MPYAAKTLRPNRAFKRETRSSTKMGYGYQWQLARVRFLLEHPFCECENCKGKGVRASVVDHITPHKGDKELFWNEENWQALSKRCHDKKTARECALTA